MSHLCYLLVAEFREGMKHTSRNANVGDQGTIFNSEKISIAERHVSQWNDSKVPTIFWAVRSTLSKAFELAKTRPTKVAGSLRRAVR